MPTLTAVTLTGDRESGIRLCAKYVNRQTRPPDRWLVVDDGATPVNPSVVGGAHVITRTPTTIDAAHTLPQNLLTALPLVATDFLVFMEDDDWYHPEYLARMERWLLKAPLAGEFPALYYRAASRMWRTMPAKLLRPHASLACTGVAQSMFPALAAACIGGNPSVDLRLWRNVFAARRYLHSPQPRLCVGIKGLDGRRGQTMGWGGNEKGYVRDADMSYLRKLIGDDADAYADFYQGVPEPRTRLRGHGGGA